MGSLQSQRCFSTLSSFRYWAHFMIFHNDSFPTPPARSPRGFFSNTYCRNRVEILELDLIILWVPSPPWLGPLDFVTFRVFHTEPPSLLQLQLRFPTQALVLVVVFSYESAPWSHNSLCSPVWLLRDSGLSCILFSLRDSESVDFRVC